MEIFESLGINWKVLLGQIINFLLILYLLKRFALKPFLKILTERKERIEKGIEKANEAEKRLQAVGQERDKILRESQEKAVLTLKKSEERGKEKETEILKLAEEEKQRLIKEARKLGQIEVDKMKGDFSKKNLGLVLNLTEKILREKVDLKKDSELIKNFLSHFQNEKDSKIG